MPSAAPRGSPRSRGALAVPLRDPAFPLSETHVYVGSLRSAHLATHAERKEAVQTYGGWRFASPVQRCVDCGIAHSSQNLAMIRN